MSVELELVTNLDCAGFDLNGISFIDPVPDSLVGSGDPRLTDQRTIVAGSITDASVNAKAGIQQSKLNLNGTMPSAWIGTGSGQAARGNITEHTNHRDQVSGYPSLDANGDVALGELPSTGPQSGTVTQVGLDMPDEFGVAVMSFSSFNVTWKNVPNNSFFGVNGPDPYGNFRPNFVTRQLPIGLIPSLDASKFTTGLFDLLRLPVVVGMGVGHAPGIVPDPGDGLSTPGDKTDFLSRAGTWRSIRSVNNIQPFAPSPVIIFLSFYGTQVNVQISSTLPGCNLFYRVLPAINNVYIPATANPFTILVGQGLVVSAYVAKAGYNNSPIVQYVTPTNPTHT